VRGQKQAAIFYRVPLRLRLAHGAPTRLRAPTLQAGRHRFFSTAEKKLTRQKAFFTASQKRGPGAQTAARVGRSLRRGRTPINPPPPPFQGGTGKAKGRNFLRK